MIEQAQIIQTGTQAGLPHNASSFSKPSSLARGLLHDMKEIEQPQQSYPETSAFLYLLENLLSNAKFGHIDSIYCQLGSPDRIGGVKPYISFVIDDIYLRIDELPFKDEVSKWELSYQCLQIMHIAVQVVDVESAVIVISNSDESGDAIDSNATSPLNSIGLHPGFEVLCRILNRTALTLKLFQLIVTGNEVDPLLAPYTQKCILICLNILQIVMSKQKTLIEIIAPEMLRKNTLSLFNVPVSMACLEQLIVVDRQIVVQIALLINSREDIAHLAVKILQQFSESLSFSGGFNRLLGFIGDSDSSDQIIQGFVDRLEFDVPDMTESLDRNLGYSIRLSILNFLTFNLQNRRMPNIASFLLGIGDNQLLSKNYQSVEKKAFAFVSIIDLLSRGVQKEEDNALCEPFFLTNPLLAEKCYLLVYIACSHPELADETLRYLRNRDFFVSQLEAFILTEHSPDTPSELIIARMYQLSWLLKVISLELHFSFMGKQRTQSIRIMNLLFTITSRDRYSDSDNYEFEQPLTKVVDILRMLNFDDSKVVGNSHAFLENFVSASNFSGIQLYNIQGIRLYLSSQNVSADIAYNAIAVAVEANENQEMNTARFRIFESWGVMIRTAVYGYFDLFSLETRQARICEILTSLLHKVNESGTSASISNSAPETVMALLACLEKDRKEQKNSRSSEDMKMERLDSQQVVILRGILDGILAPGSTARRGTYYSSLIAFINCFKADKGEDILTEAFAATISTIVSYGDRLLEKICVDACDSEFVWQTVAYGLLACLIKAANNKSKALETCHILIFLIKRNFLGHFVRLLNHNDDALLQEDEQDEFRYVFEMKMTLFMRIAETKGGAEALFETGILEALTNCQFLDQYPETQYSMDNMLADSKHEVFHEIFILSISVILSLLPHIDAENEQIWRKVIFC